MRSVRRFGRRTMLMKPRRWLAYTVELNDLLPCYEELLNRFERSEIPIDGTFGSNTSAGSEVPGLVLAVGPAVEPQRLVEILNLIVGLGQVFLVVNEDGPHNKSIAVGALNLNRESVVAMTDELVGEIRRPGSTSEDLRTAINDAPQVRVFAAKESGNEPDQHG